MKKLSLLLAILFTFTLVATACSSNNDEPSKAKLPKEVTIGYQNDPDAKTVARVTGAVEKKFPGVKINFQKFESGPDVNAAFASGSIDFGELGSVPTAVGLSNKLPYKVFYLHSIIGDGESLIVQKDANIGSVADLKGKKIGVKFGSTSHFSLLQAIKLAGLSAKDVTILDFKPADIVAAWQRKDIDGAFIWDPSLSKLKADGGVIITSAAKLAEQGAVTANVGVVSNDFAKQYPDFVKQYVSVLDEQVKKYRSNPTEVAASIAESLSTTPEDALVQTKGLQWLTSKEQLDSKYLGAKAGEGDFAQILLDTANFLYEQKTLTTQPELATFQDGILHTAIGGSK